MCPLTCLQYPGIGDAAEILLMAHDITVEVLGHMFIEHLCLGGDDRMYEAASISMRYVAALRGVCDPQVGLPLPYLVPDSPCVWGSSRLTLPFLGYEWMDGWMDGWVNHNHRSELTVLSHQGRTLNMMSRKAVANATMMRVETMMRLVPGQSVAVYKALYANWRPRAQEHHAAGLGPIVMPA